MLLALSISLVKHDTATTRKQNTLQAAALFNLINQQC